LGVREQFDKLRLILRFYVIACDTLVLTSERLVAFHPTLQVSGNLSKRFWISVNV
jgi:hypothetical protein